MVCQRKWSSTFAPLNNRIEIHDGLIRWIGAWRGLLLAGLVGACSNNALVSKPAQTADIPPTTCRVPVSLVSGEVVAMTVNEYLVSLNDEFERYNSDLNSCDIFTRNASPAVALFSNSDGAGLDVYFGNNSRLIDSAAQYNDCARDIEAAAAERIGDAVDSCPVPVRLNKAEGVIRGVIVRL